MERLPRVFDGVPSPFRQHKPAHFSASIDRGGVIGGGSAGASIQASYMVRGSYKPDDNTIMMAPGHETGFGFFTNTATDQHVDARGRENDLGVVMKAHPDLLGIGIDQSSSITVHGDVLTANGPERIAIWDGKDHDGKPYYYLRLGNTLNHGHSRGEDRRASCRSGAQGNHFATGNAAAVRRVVPNAANRINDDYARRGAALKPACGTS